MNTFKRSLFVPGLIMLLMTGFCSAISAGEKNMPPVRDPKDYHPDPYYMKLIANYPTLVERKIDRAMRKYLNEPQTLVLNFTPINETETLQGRYARIFVKVGRGSADHLVVEDAEFEFLDVLLDINKLLREDKIDTVTVKSINMNVRITEADLNAFLRQKAKKIKVDNPKAELKADSITVSGSTKYGFMKVVFWATGNFSVHQAREIYFYARKVKVNGMTMPRGFVGSLVKQINPIMNLDKFPFQLNLQQIRIEPGLLLFTSSRAGN
ncbi:MAG TPA: DUF2993 domain-containing protein [Candidatus Ozemobacteraceae bacterium]|nr:DUF2993 domain-containing protein [Candidatus Ozemobacteraceae bacterium]